MHLKQKSLKARLLLGAIVSITGITAAFSAPAAWAGWNDSAEPIQKNHPTWLYTPASTMTNGKRALLIVMHGCDQSHDQLKVSGNLVSTADTRGVVMAVPSVGSKPWPMVSSVKCWNYDGATDGSGHIAEMVELTNTLINRSDLNIDKRHVYITGLSSGASLALDVACKAPDLIAGVGAIAGPSVGSSQMDATKDASGISYTPEQARDKCKALAGKSKLPYLDTQIANIAYGEKDKNAESPGCSYSAGATSCPGTFQLVSKKWGTINAEMFRQIYESSAFGAPILVADGTGKESTSTKNVKPVVALTSILGVGHAWPAGSGAANSINNGGIWMAQNGMNYSQYVVDWFFANHRRGGITCDAQPNGDANLTVSGDAGANGATIIKWKVVINGPTPISDDPAAGAAPSFSKTYGPIAAGPYTANVSATDNAGNEFPCTTSSTQVGPVPLLDPPAVSKQSATSTSITLSWPIVKDARGYNVTRTGGSPSPVQDFVPQPATGTVTYTTSGLSPATTYTFSVQTVNAANKPGNPSAPLPVTTELSNEFVCTSFTASNKAHVDAKRAYDYFYQAFAKGSNLYLGWDNSYVVTTIAEVKPGYFVYGKCPAK